MMIATCRAIILFPSPPPSPAGLISSLSSFTLLRSHTSLSSALLNELSFFSGKFSIAAKGSFLIHAKKTVGCKGGEWLQLKGHFLFFNRGGRPPQVWSLTQYFLLDFNNQGLWKKSSSLTKFLHQFFLEVFRDLWGPLTRLSLTDDFNLPSKANQYFLYKKADRIIELR